jgi:hypothetical protein
MLQIIKRIYRFTTERNDDGIKSIATSTNEDYCCSQCELNHETRDFI